MIGGGGIVVIVTGIGLVVTPPFCSCTNAGPVGNPAGTRIYAVDDVELDGSTKPLAVAPPLVMVAVVSGRFTPRSARNPIPVAMAPGETDPSVGVPLIDIANVPCSVLAMSKCDPRSRNP